MEQIILNATSLKDVVKDAVFEAIESLNKDKKRFYTKADLCKELQVSLMTINNYVNKRILKPKKIGNRVLFEAEEVEKAINECTLMKYSHVMKKGGVKL